MRKVRKNEIDTEPCVVVCAYPLSMVVFVVNLISIERWQKSLFVTLTDGDRIEPFMNTERVISMRYVRLSRKNLR